MCMLSTDRRNMCQWHSLPPLSQLGMSLSCLQWWFHLMAVFYHTRNGEYYGKCIVHRWIHRHLFCPQHWLSWNLICFFIPLRNGLSCDNVCKFHSVLDKVLVRAIFPTPVTNFSFSDFLFSPFTVWISATWANFSCSWMPWACSQTFLNHGHSRVMLWGSCLPAIEYDYGRLDFFVYEFVVELACFKEHCHEDFCGFRSILC